MATKTRYHTSKKIATRSLNQAIASAQLGKWVAVRYYLWRAYAYAPRYTGWHPRIVKLLMFAVRQERNAKAA